MIVAAAEELKKYGSVLPSAEKIADFIKEWSKNPKGCGRYDIDGDNLFAAVSEYETESFDERQFESHQKYIDVQYVPSGEETLYWADVKTLTQTSESFSQGGDIAFYKGKAQGSVTLCGGTCAVLFPEDAHMPNCISGKKQKVTKIVFKVKI